MFCRRDKLKPGPSRLRIGPAHPAGTCRIGTDEDAVVSPDLRVRGTQGLWIAGASVFPAHITGNINATILMIGEKAADLLKAA